MHSVVTITQSVAVRARPRMLCCPPSPAAARNHENLTRELDRQLRDRRRRGRTGGRRRRRDRRGSGRAHRCVHAGETGVAATVLEADTVVGGISRTAERDGWRFDIGGHRFFTKVQAGRGPVVRDPRARRLPAAAAPEPHLLPRQVLRLPDRADERAAESRVRRGACGAWLSYVWVRIHPPKDQSTLEGFVASRFGWRLYRHFFKTQSEKVWGVPCTEIQADWGAQRIKDLSLFRAVWEALKPKRLQRRDEVEAGHEPHRGVQLPEVRARHDVGALRGDRHRAGHEGRVRTRVGDRIAARRTVAPSSVTAVTDGVPTRYECTHVISSMPIGALLRAMDPPRPGRRARGGRRRCATATSSPSRSSCPRSDAFPDNWIYINDANVKVGRIQNFGRVVAVSGQGRPHVPRARAVRQRGRRVVDDVDDAELIEHGKRELEQHRAASTRPQVEAGYVVRMPKAYPFYDARYKENVATLAGVARRTRRTCIRWAATACTGTTTRTTRCSPRCCRSRTSSARTTTSGPSTSKPSTTRSAATTRSAPTTPVLRRSHVSGRRMEWSTAMGGAYRDGCRGRRHRDRRAPFDVRHREPGRAHAVDREAVLGAARTHADRPRVERIGSTPSTPAPARRMRSPTWAAAWRGHAASRRRIPTTRRSTRRNGSRR